MVFCDFGAYNFSLCDATEEVSELRIGLDPIVRQPSVHDTVVIVRVDVVA